MKNIVEVEKAVNKELQFGKLTHLPIVAWAFDMSVAEIEPVPVTIGDYAKSLKNYSGHEIHLVPANPGFFQMIYLASLKKEQLEKLSAELRAEIKRAAGAFGLGVWTPEDTETDWRQVALMEEEDLFEVLFLLEDLVPSRYSVSSESSVNLEDANTGS